MSESLRSQETLRGPDVVFGTTMNRYLFTEKPLTNRLGGETTFHHESHLGPGCYENDEATRSIAMLYKHVESNKGYGFSCRTATRFPKPLINDYPSPAAYQKPKSINAKPAYKPFGTCMKLPQIDKKTFAPPGPGAYNHNIQRNRHITCPVAFGRKPLRSGLKIKYHLSEDNKVMTEKELRKLQYREAYLSLYF